MLQFGSLSEIRKAALFGFVASLLSLPLPLWNTTRMIAQATPTVRSDLWWFAPIGAVALLLPALEPAFFFTLYRNQGPLRMSDRLRWLARTAAFIFGIIVAEGLVEWLKSSGPYLQSMEMLDWTMGAASVRAAQQDPRTIGQLSNLFGELSNIAVVLLLIALFRHEDDEPDAEVPISRPLLIVTKVAVITGALVLAFCVIRLAYMPILHSQMRDLAPKVFRTPPPLSEMLIDAIRGLLIAACLFTSPYIVYRSRLSPTALACTDPSDTALPDEHSPDSSPGT
jgi:hypothetical protein